MRLLIVGTLEGHITTAGKIALDRGAKVAHAEDIETALALLRAGRGADLLMIDIKLEVGEMVESLRQERISIPVVACGIGTDSAAAVKAIRAGAREYVPLPPDPELIAAVLEAVSASRSLTTTAAPSAAKRSALARPIPRPAPVTTAILPWSLPVMFSSSFKIS